MFDKYFVCRSEYLYTKHEICDYKCHKILKGLNDILKNEKVTAFKYQGILKQILRDISNYFWYINL